MSVSLCLGGFVICLVEVGVGIIGDNLQLEVVNHLRTLVLCLGSNVCVNDSRCLAALNCLKCSLCCLLVGIAVNCGDDTVILCRESSDVSSIAVVVSNGLCLIEECGEDAVDFSFLVLHTILVGLT